MVYYVLLCHSIEENYSSNIVIGGGAGHPPLVGWAASEA
jgi:heme O synthase-like polyprenyltransferase